MSFRNRFQPQQQPFRESLTYEDIIRSQVQRCIDNFNEGDQEAIMFSVEALTISINEKMADQPFRDRIADMGRKWEVDRMEAERAYFKELSASDGGCPDLVEKPSLKPGIDYWKEIYCICLDLFQRKGLLLKEKVVDPLG